MHFEIYYTESFRHTYARQDKTIQFDMQTVFPFLLSAINPNYPRYYLYYMVYIGNLASQSLSDICIEILYRDNHLES